LPGLLAAFERAHSGRRPRLVTLIGPAGIGKSRLVAEFGARGGADGDLVAWRVGRSLPYGEAMAFWALAEIVKAEAGIQESDTADRVERKLADAVGLALEGEPNPGAWA